MSSSPRRLLFLSLPNLVQENILKRVNLIDVVSLSLCSARASKCINSLRVTNLRDPEGPLSGGGVHVEITNAHVSVVFQDKVRKLSLRILDSKGTVNYKDLLYSPIYRKGYVHMKRSKRVFKRSADGMEMEFQRTYFDPRTLKEIHLVAEHSRNHAEAAKRAVEHICYIFRLPITRVSINVHEIRNFWNLFIWDLLRGSCPDIQLHGETIQDCKKNKFFENFRIEKGLAFEVKNCGDLSFQMEKLRNLDYLVLQNASWMEDHHFEQLNCEFLEVHKTQITAQAINNWLHNWIRSSETRTKVLMISPTRQKYDKMIILQGLPRTMQCEGRHKSIGKFGSFTRPLLVGNMSRMDDCTITRADGAVATISGGAKGIRVYMSYN